MSADVEAESFIFNGACQSAHDRVLFQHQARRAQVRKTVSRRQSPRTGAEVHHVGLAVACAHSYARDAATSGRAFAGEARRVSEKAASLYLSRLSCLS